MASKRQRYERKLNQILRQHNRLEAATLERIVKLLRRLRANIAVEVTDLGELDAGEFQRLKVAIGQLLTEFEANSTAAWADALIRDYRLGGDLVREPLLAIDAAVSMFSPNAPGDIENLVRGTTGLIQNITNDMRRRINTQLSIALLGKQPPYQTMRQINNILGLRAGKRQLVKGITARTETIVRTEMNRVFNLSAYRQAEHTAELEPGLLKRWVATGDTRTRESHLRTHRNTAVNPIPLNQKFTVGNDKLRFPLDPRGSAKETINCRCRMVIVHPEIGVIDSPLDVRVKRQLQKT